MTKLAMNVLFVIVARSLLPMLAELDNDFDVVFSTDSECQTSGDAKGQNSQCALNALQLRGVKVVAPSTDGLAPMAGKSEEAAFVDVGTDRDTSGTSLQSEVDSSVAKGTAEKARGRANSSSAWPFGNTETTQPGTCAKSTGGSCMLFSCKSGRNSMCDHGSCVCRTNFCGTTAGMCEIPKSFWKANVVRVDERHPNFPAPHNQIDTAICLSGGGARAAALTVGVLRALENLGLMPNVDAISSVSGSLFVSINYMFADPSRFSRRKDMSPVDQPLWGLPSTPTSLTLQVLDYDTSPLETLFADGWGGTWATAKDLVRKFIPQMTSDRAETDAAWRNMMRTQFLDPFGLGDLDEFLAADAAAVARIRALNPQIANFSFMVPQPGKPKVFVIGATILAVEGQAKTDAASFQISPDYTGHHRRRPRGDLRCGWRHPAGSGWRPSARGAAVPSPPVHSLRCPRHCHLC